MAPSKSLQLDLQDCTSKFPLLKRSSSFKGMLIVYGTKCSNGYFTYAAKYITDYTNTTRDLVTNDQYPGLSCSGGSESARVSLFFRTYRSVQILYKALTEAPVLPMFVTILGLPLESICGRMVDSYTMPPDFPQYPGWPPRPPGQPGPPRKYRKKGSPNTPGWPSPSRPTIPSQPTLLHASPPPPLVPESPAKFFPRPPRPPPPPDLTGNPSASVRVEVVLADIGIDFISEPNKAGAIQVGTCAALKPAAQGDTCTALKPAAQVNTCTALKPVAQGDTCAALKPAAQVDYCALISISPGSVVLSVSLTTYRGDGKWNGHGASLEAAALALTESPGLLFPRSYYIKYGASAIGLQVFGEEGQSLLLHPAPLPPVDNDPKETEEPGEEGEGGEAPADSSDGSNGPSGGLIAGAVILALLAAGDSSDDSNGLSGGLIAGAVILALLAAGDSSDDSNGPSGGLIAGAVILALLAAGDSSDNSNGLSGGLIAGAVILALLAAGDSSDDSNGLSGGLIAGAMILALLAAGDSSDDSNGLSGGLIAGAVILALLAAADSSGDSNGLSGGLIAGAVILALLAAGIVAALGCIGYTRWRASKEASKCIVEKSQSEDVSLRMKPSLRHTRSLNKVAPISHANTSKLDQADSDQDWQKIPSLLPPLQKIPSLLSPLQKMLSLQSPLKKGPSLYSDVVSEQGSQRQADQANAEEALPNTSSLPPSTLVQSARGSNASRPSSVGLDGFGLDGDTDKASGSGYRSYFSSSQRATPLPALSTLKETSHGGVDSV
eukprot:gene17824-24207_t